MRKLKLQMQMTVDGYISGPNGEMDWMTLNWDDALNDYVKGITDPVDTIILGRKLAEGFIPYWTEMLETGGEEAEGADKMVYTDKVVFTKTLKNSQWERTELATGDLPEEITKLKNREGKDIIVYGGGTFVASLIKAGLIDELHLLVNPAVIGEGVNIFEEITDKQNLTLIRSEVFPCGIVVLCYLPNR